MQTEPQNIKKPEEELSAEDWEGRPFTLKGYDFGVHINESEVVLHEHLPPLEKHRAAILVKENNMDIDVIGRPRNRRISIVGWSPDEEAPLEELLVGVELQGPLLIVHEQVCGVYFTDTVVVLDPCLDYSTKRMAMKYISREILNFQSEIIMREYE